MSQLGALRLLDVAKNDMSLVPDVLGTMQGLQVGFLSQCVAVCVAVCGAECIAVIGTKVLVHEP